ncbi:flippase [Bacillus tianshenii]|uniref:flippase n=1 Tax=Sutcliffiella tianshenii TaxID=1463404 RepID=UPI001CD5598B|nr:flippase [Bacillus tianshenii]MCA1320488.1 flippase [Bacillus tianshenii]
MSKLKKNFIYVFIQQFILIGLPFLTIPYISRVLGPDGVGLYSYSFSVVTMTINVLLLGSNLYAAREIARVKDDRENLSGVFSDILYIRVFLLSVASIAYLAICYIFFSDSIVFYLQIIHLIAAYFDITWLFQGLENFKKVVIRNVLVKLLGFISIFIFVKDENDLFLYTIIMGVSVLLGNGLLFYKLREAVSFTRISSSLKVKKHINEMLILFIPAFSAMIYSVLDKTMIGALSTTTQVGYYEQSYKIVYMITSIINVTGIVMLPRTSSMIANNQMEKLHEVFRNGVQVILLLSFPLVFGLILIADDFVVWFLGDSFEASVIICMVMAPIILFKALGVVFGSWYLVPMGMNRQYTIPIVVGAVFNIIFNFILIPFYGAMGAAVATVTTEAIIVCIQIWLLRKTFEATFYLKGFLKFGVLSLVMFGVVFGMTNLMGEQPALFAIIIKVATGALLYLLLLILTKDATYKWILQNLKRRKG